MNLPSIIHTSQAAIIDPRERVFLHRWNKFAKIAFLGWAKDKWEKPITTLRRELKEELDIMFASEQIVQLHRDSRPVELEHGRFRSTFFWIKVSERFAQQYLLAHQNVTTLTRELLEKVNPEDFIIPKKKFLQRVDLALNHTY